MRDAYFGTSVELRIEAYYIEPVLPRNWLATSMSIGLVTPPITDPRLDMHSLSGVS